MEDLPAGVPVFRRTLAFWGLAACASLLRFAFIAFVGRALDPPEFADFVAALSLYFIMSTALGSFGSAVARETSLRGLRGVAWPAVRSFTGRQAPAIVLVLAVAALSIPIMVGLLHFDSAGPPLLAFACGAALVPLEIVRGRLRGLQAFHLLGWSLFAEGLLRFGLAAMFLQLAPTATVALVAVCAAELGALFVRSSPSAADASRDDSGATGSAGVPHLAGFFMLAVAGAMYQQIDVLAVKRFFPPTDAASYAGVAGLAKMVGFLFLPFGSTLLPVWTERHSRGGDLRRDLLRSTGWFLVGLIPILALTRLLARPIVSVAYGGAYTEFAFLLPVLASGLGLVFMTILVAQAYAATGRFGFLRVYVFGLICEAYALWRAASLAEVAAVTVVMPMAMLLILGLMATRGLRPTLNA